MYPNLNELAETDLAEKVSIDDRINSCDLTERGHREIEAATTGKISTFLNGTFDRDSGVLHQSWCAPDLHTPSQKINDERSRPSHMTMSSHVAPSVAEVLRALLSERSELSEVFVVGFTEEPIAALVEVLADLDDSPSVQVLTTESLLKWLRSDFHLASTAADLVAAETLSLQVPGEETFEPALVVDEESVVSVVTAGNRAVALGTDDAEFVANMRERCTTGWETGETFDLRTPPRSRIYETLSTEIGSDVAEDLHTMFEAVETTQTKGYGSTADDTLDEVDLTLLAAAKHEVQLYEISRWGEDTGLASKATFSRTKNRLEDQGMIATEKVPIDVGRPRLRLVLGADRLREVETIELPAAAQEILASAST